jgi:hypothetical protein
LPDDHPALVKGQSLFQARVEDQSERPRLLIDGHNSRKIGKRVTKGRYKDFFIFTLTLEERATCPSSCLEWKTCYGNSMNWARRIKHGREFEERLWNELADKQAPTPKAFLSAFTFSATSTRSITRTCGPRRLRLIRRSTSSATRRAIPKAASAKLFAKCSACGLTRFHVRFSGYNGPTNGSVVIDDADETHRPRNLPRSNRKDRLLRHLCPVLA